MRGLKRTDAGSSTLDSDDAEPVQDDRSASWNPDPPDAVSGDRRQGDHQGTDANGAARELELTARSIRWRDLAALFRISGVHVLNRPETSIGGFSVARDAIRAAIPVRQSRPRVYAASVGERVVGFVEFLPVLPDRRWHALAIGTETGVYEPSPVVDVLLRHAVTAAGLRGVKRLYARIPSGTDLVDSFCGVGFSPFATETIFLAMQPEASSGGAAPRKQEQTDTWAIHQLYSTTVPKQVQYAEALTSHRWDVSGADELAGRAELSGWLVDEGHAVAAYARMATGRKAHSIELLYLPHHSRRVGELLDWLISEILSRKADKPVYCVLRGYQAEAVKELEARGFEPEMEQDLLVKYTTAPARVHHAEPVPLHAEVIERLPKRVPTFLKQGPRNTSAG